MQVTWVKLRTFLAPALNRSQCLVLSPVACTRWREPSVPIE